jgi:hypothetical protein
MSSLENGPINRNYFLTGCVNQFIGFCRELLVVHCENKNRGLTKLNITKKHY